MTFYNYGNINAIAPVLKSYFGHNIYFRQKKFVYGKVVVVKSDSCGKDQNGQIEN